MTQILDLKSGRAWRERWMPAAFRNARFHVDAGSRESGRRIVSHEFPKRDVPYAEDMGRKAREFSVRGYIVVYPKDASSTNTQISSELQKKNYIPARDALIKALEEEGPAKLQLPLLGELNVACSRYRVTEENRLGGYCVFDMTFTEFGQAPAEGARQSTAGVEYAAASVGDAAKNTVSSGIKAATSGVVP